MIQSLIKNPLSNAGDTRDTGSIPGWGRPLEKEMATHSSILAWRILWTDELGGLQSRGSQSQTQLKGLSTQCIHLDEFKFITFWTGPKPSQREPESCWVQHLLIEVLWPTGWPYLGQTHFTSEILNRAEFSVRHSARFDHNIRDPWKCFIFF